MPTSTQNAVAAALRHGVVAPPLVQLIQTSAGNFIQKSTFTLTSNQTYPLPVTGDFICVLPSSDTGDGTSEVISVNPMGQPELKFLGGVRTTIKYKKPFELLQIKNLQALAKTVEIITGFGEFDVRDGTLIQFRQTNVVKTVSIIDPLPVQIQASSTSGITELTKLIGTKAVALAATPEVIYVGAALCRHLKLQAATTNTDLIRIGDVTGQHLYLAPGQIEEWLIPLGFSMSLGTLYCRVAVNGESVNYFALTN